ncbi:LPXTG cell wall anchor domain-containing protein [Levilactobacillus fuyuanensis]|uniref:LPXTG cell wall anchor domain-containing protein n=1 Tax=Levilactobacillus fuyuanensis TaxID=2486022 RepID=A0ABW4H4Q3_9LACO|nr:LPXTG cell wall anchor domain-containing protein [Levilactobacillus fuyuanensis]
MKKIIRRLVAVVAVALGLGFGTTAFAESTDSGNMGSTSMGITIVNNNPHDNGSGGNTSTGTDSGGNGDAVDPNSPGKQPAVTNGGDGDTVNEDIPSGHNPTTSVTSGHSAANKPAGAVASVVHSGTADLVAGRLPQTGESQVFLASVFGLFLLIAITLLAVVRWQARLLRENK